VSVKAGDRVLVKRHLDVDRVPVGPGEYEVVEKDPGAGQMDVETARRATSRQGNAEVVEGKSKTEKKG
jgi:hypothetical protein